MRTKLFVFSSLFAFVLFPAYPAHVVAENLPGPHMEGDLDGDVDVDFNDVDLLDQFVGGQEEPEQWQFWRGDIHPFVLNGTDLCPQWDGVLTWDDWEAFFYVTTQYYSFAWEDECPYLRL